MLSTPSSTQSSNDFADDVQRIHHLFFSSNHSDDSSTSSLTPPAYPINRHLNLKTNPQDDHLQKSNTTHLTEWLNIRKLLNEFNENALLLISNTALISIIDSIYFNRQQFISFLYKHMDLDYYQLHNIYNILKDDMLHNNPPGHALTSPNSNRNKFDQLSIPSIENICSYLSKYDLLSFKNTSLHIAVIALQEMNKYHIEVFNMNELFCNYYNNFAILKHVETQNAIKTVRYTPSMTMKKIIQNWSKNYGIEPQNMALIHTRCDGLHQLQMIFNVSLFLECLVDEESIMSHTLITNYMDLAQFSVKDVFGDRFLVFDKSKMCTIYDIEQEEFGDIIPGNPISCQWPCGKCTFRNAITSNHCSMCGSFKDNIHSKQYDNTRFAMITQTYGQQCVILLNYFDLKQQKITFCRYLIVHKKYTLDDLKNYIKKHVQIWLGESDSELFELLSIKDFTVELYGYRGDFWHCGNQNNIKDERDFVEIYAFQLYSSYVLMSVQDDNYICNVRAYYDLILNESFCTNPIALMRDIYKRLKWKNHEDFGDMLSPLLTAHICSFLDPIDINSFKMVSSATAMVCLKEMRKINIPSLYMPTILTNNMRDLSTFTVEKYINYARFHKETLMRDVAVHWSHKYHIPKDDLLILLCHQTPCNSKLILQLLCDTDIDVLTDTSTMFLKAKTIKGLYTFLICDKRKMFQVNAYHLFVPNKIILLNFFDFRTKDVLYYNPIMPFPKQHITLHDITSFIMENAREFMSDALYQTIHQMRELNATQNIFKFYTTSFDKQNEIKCKRLNKIRTSRLFSNVIFQINNEHDLFVPNLWSATPTAPSFFRRIHALVSFRYINNGYTLAQCMRYFNAPDSIMRNFYYPSQMIRIQAGPDDNGQALCKLLSQQFQYKIPSPQIQLFVNLQSGVKYMHCYESLIDIGLFTWDVDKEKYIINDFGRSALSWTIIPGCWLQKFSLGKMTMYHINVYTPNNILLVHGHETSLPDTPHRFYVPFKRKFAVKELIDYLECICEGMYIERSKALLKYFGGSGNILRDKYSWVISSSCTGLMENCYEYDSIIKYKVNASRKIDVFVVDNRTYRDYEHELEQYPVIIRFKKTATKEKKRRKYEIGRPERMWITKSDLLTTFEHSPSSVRYTHHLNTTFDHEESPFLALINVEVHCFYNQISPGASRKQMLNNDSELITAIWDKQSKHHTSKVFHVLVVTE
eukprot:87555_1